MLNEEVGEAYADCEWLRRNWTQEREREALSKRNLSFRASQAVSRDKTIALFKDHVPGYNAFEPSLLETLPEDSEITIAREGSVCIYIKGNLEEQMGFSVPDIRDKLSCDEINYKKSTDETRIWWD